MNTSCWHKVKPPYGEQNLKPRPLGADSLHGGYLGFEKQWASTRLHTTPHAAIIFVLAVPDPNMNDAEYSNSHQIIRNLNNGDLSSWSLPSFKRRRAGRDINLPGAQETLI